MVSSKLEGLLKDIQIVKEKELSKNPNYEGRFGKIMCFHPKDESYALVEQLDLNNFSLSEHVVEITLCGSRNKNTAELLKFEPLKEGDWIVFHVLGLHTDTDGFERSYGLGDWQIEIPEAIESFENLYQKVKNAVPRA